MNQFKQTLFISLIVSLLCLNAQAAKKEKVAKVAASPAPVATPAEVAPSPTPVATPVATPAATPVATPVEVAPTPAPVVEAPKIEDMSDRYGKTSRPLGDWLVGPYATAVALPRPVSFGLEAKFKDLLGVSAGYGFFPQLSFDSVKVKITGWDARFKIYPFKGGFFIGVAYGSQTFTGSMTQTILTIPTTGTVTQDNTFIAPHIGWNWIWGSGFFMGMDLGVQLSMKRSTTFSSDVTNTAVTSSTEYTQLQKDVLDKADLVGKTPLPLLTLIKVGYFF